MHLTNPLSLLLPLALTASAATIGPFTITASWNLPTGTSIGLDSTSSIYLAVTPDILPSTFQYDTITKHITSLTPSAKKNSYASVGPAGAVLNKFVWVPTSATGGAEEAKFDFVEVTPGVEYLIWGHTGNFCVRPGVGTPAVAQEIFEKPDASRNSGNAFADDCLDVLLHANL